LHFGYEDASASTAGKECHTKEQNNIRHYQVSINRNTHTTTTKNHKHDSTYAYTLLPHSNTQELKLREEGCLTYLQSLAGGVLYSGLHTVLNVLKRPPEPIPYAGDFS